MQIAHDHPHSHDHEHHDHDHHHHDHDHGTERAAVIQALVKTALLIGLSLYFGWLILTDNLTNYINYRFSWLAYLAVVLFGLMGALSLWQVYRQSVRPVTHDHAPIQADHAHDGHDHGPVTWGVLAIIAVPLVLGTLIPSRPLGAEAVGTISTGGAAQAMTMGSFDIAPDQRNVLDWLRAFNSATDYSQLNGLPVDVIGFVYTEPDFNPGTFMVARFTVSCCVADANAIGLPVAYADVAQLPQGEWVRVTGTMQVGTFREETLPIVQVSAVEIVPQPAHPYLYP